MEWLHARTVYYSVFCFAQACGVVSLVLLGSLFGGFLDWRRENGYFIHAFVMLAGIIYLQGTAISAFRILNSFDRVKVKIAHMAIHFIIFAMNVIGLVAIFDFKSTHLTSLHGWCGLITVILFSGQVLFSFLGFFYPKAPSAIRETLMPHHRHLGLAIFALAVITASMRLNDIFSLGKQAQVIWTGLLALLFGITIFVSVLAKRFKRENVYD